MLLKLYALGIMIMLVSSTTTFFISNALETTKNHFNASVRKVYLSEAFAIPLFNNSAR